MTIICANHKMLSGDSIATQGGLRTKCCKVFKSGGDIAGFAGNLQDGQAFREWYEKKGDKPTLDDDFSAIVLTGAGKLVCYESNLIPIPFIEPYIAIGCGQDYATACMDCGKTPEEAVKMTIKRIDGCGGRVVTFVRE